VVEDFRMRAQLTKTDLHRLGDVVLKISVGVAMLGLAIWLFAPDSWFSGKSAAVVALFALPAGFALYGLTRLLGRILPDSAADDNSAAN
jgi:hypothetical protein